MFLTSLLWQLREWENSEFRLANDAKISRFSPRNGRPPPDDAFPFDKFQDALVVRREWPAKTRDIQRYSCEFVRSDRSRWRATQRLEFIDLPGERVADAAIAEFHDYGEWSDHMFRHFDSGSEYEAGRRFRAAIEAQLTDPDGIVRNYRRVLADFVKCSKPLVTPSVFLLDREGRVAPHVDTGQEHILVEQRLTGLDAKAQFAPLSQAVRDSNPKLTTMMEKHYRKYRKELAQPFFEHLATSDSLIVLVDIPLLLRGSAGRFNDTRQTIEDLLAVMSQETALGRRFARTLKTVAPTVAMAVNPVVGIAAYANKRRKRQPKAKPSVPSLTSLSRIAFVANKADLVSREDWKNGGLKGLLRQMTTRARELLPNVDAGSFVCSACVSTRPGNQPSTLIGAPLHDNPKQDDYEYEVSRLPETWPREWQSGDFDFRDVCPKLGSNVLYPPAQHGLDRVFDFVAMG